MDAETCHTAPTDLSPFWRWGFRQEHDRSVVVGTTGYGYAWAWTHPRTSVRDPGAGLRDR